MATPTPGDPRAVVVESKKRIASAVVELTLVSRDGELPAWEPGAHVDLVLPNGIVRQYSLCGDVADRDRLTVAVLEEPQSRGGSSYLANAVQVGDQLEVVGPRNTFELHDAERYLFIAGGIGVTPLIPMIQRVAASGADWQLFYFGRSVSSMAYVSELARHRERVTFVTKDSPSNLSVAELINSVARDTVVYCCGPERLIDAADEATRELGVEFHREYFVPKTVAGRAPDTSFEVVLDYSGITVTVPANRSILDVVEEAGVMVLSSCTEGTCGTCETRVLSGMPDARDSLLTPEEQAVGDRMMICVSRCLGERLVLDL